VVAALAGLDEEPFFRRWFGRSAARMPTGASAALPPTRHGSGAIDANIEHPADYRDVSGSLREQNFLVVRGSQACPAAPDGGVLTASLNTLPHQP
jgi:hypothetical protein